MLELAQNISRLAGIAEWVEEVIVVNNRSPVSYAPVEAYMAEHPGNSFPLCHCTGEPW